MNIKRFVVALTLLSTLVVSAEMVQAQVFDSGPSDPALFTTVINLPPAPDIGTDESISGGTQLNVADGGRVSSRFDANSGSEVNISGGIVGSFFAANEGSEVNISGGEIGFRFEANQGSEVNISGGVLDGAFDADSGSRVNISGGEFGANFVANTGSQVSISGGTYGRGFTADAGTLELFGGEFQLNGAVFTGTTITLVENDVFTGTLADGSSFVFTGTDVSGLVFNPQVDDFLSGVTLSAAPLPVLDVTPVVIDSPVTEGHRG